jgi:ATP-dependent Clp protease ATP-binding subunit ClpA
MFERFTERARKVVVLAQEEARHFNHNYIGTEHLLLGLVCENEGVASQMLSSMGVEADDVYEQVIRGLAGEPGRRSASALRHVGSAESARNRLLFRGKATSLRIGAHRRSTPDAARGPGLHPRGARHRGRFEGREPR